MMNVSQDKLLNAFNKLHIPFDRSFFHLPFDHYQTLAESVGVQKTIGHIRTILLHYKNDEVIAEKARILIRKLSTKFLVESVDEQYPECECGFLIMEDYEMCPVCDKKLYTGDVCYYKNVEDGTCSIDNETCKWTGYNECKKLEVE
jgi:hypothetical protein